MRGAVSKSGGKTSLARERGRYGEACIYEAKAFSFARCKKVFADGTVRKSSA
jgi:hypothetical protein